eukprot:gene29525-biopygen5438
MSAEEDLDNQPGNAEILRYILKFSPTSDLADKCIGARESKTLATDDRNKVASYASAIPNLVALLSPEMPTRWHVLGPSLP